LLIEFLEGDWIVVDAMGSYPRKCRPFSCLENIKSLNLSRPEFRLRLPDPRSRLLSARDISSMSHFSGWSDKMVIILRSTKVAARHAVRR
jgi:hypothetical protein